jgi:hypothetical protein
MSRPFRKDCYISANDAVEGENTDIDQTARQTLHAFNTNQPPVNLECSSAFSEKMSSPGKRKGWSSSGLSVDAAETPTLNKGDRPKLEVDTKRRKLQQNFDTDVVMRSDSDLFSWDEADDNAMGAHLARVATELMGRAQTLPPSNHSLWAHQLGDNEHNSTTETCMLTAKAIPCSLASTKQTSFTWHLPKLCSNHSPASSAESSPAQEITRPVTASTAISASTDALQEQIQHNYHEFEERKKHKSAEKEYYKATVPGFDGIVSPTDADDKTFESIFMGDVEADGWSSDDDDGLSQRTGSICLKDDGHQDDSLLGTRRE